VEGGCPGAGVGAAWGRWLMGLCCPPPGRGAGGWDPGSVFPSAKVSSPQRHLEAQEQQFRVNLGQSHGFPLAQPPVGAAAVFPLRNPTPVCSVSTWRLNLAPHELLFTPSRTAKPSRERSKPGTPHTYSHRTRPSWTPQPGETPGKRWQTAFVWLIGFRGGGEESSPHRSREAQLHGFPFAQTIPWFYNPTESAP